VRWQICEVCGEVMRRRDGEQVSRRDGEEARW